MKGALCVTGRELILYILQNNLENEIIVEDKLFIALLNEKEAAVRFNVGVATIKAWRKYKRMNKHLNGNFICPLEEQKRE